MLDKNWCINKMKNEQAMHQPAGKNTLFINKQISPAFWCFNRRDPHWQTGLSISQLYRKKTAFHAFKLSNVKICQSLPSINLLNYWIAQSRSLLLNIIFIHISYECTKPAPPPQTQLTYCALFIAEMTKKSQVSDHNTGAGCRSLTGRSRLKPQGRNQALSDCHCHCWPLKQTLLA